MSATDSVRVYSTEAAAKPNAACTSTGSNELANTLSSNVASFRVLIARFFNPPREPRA